MATITKVLISINDGTLSVTLTYNDANNRASGLTITNLSQRNGQLRCYIPGVEYIVRQGIAPGTRVFTLPNIAMPSDPVRGIYFPVNVEAGH